MKLCFKKPDKKMIVDLDKKEILEGLGSMPQEPVYLSLNESTYKRLKNQFVDEGKFIVKSVD